MKLLFIDCRNLLKTIPNKQITHTYREANQYADTLAKLGANSLSSFAVFFSPPPMVERIMTFDKASLYCNKLINS